MTRRPSASTAIAFVLLFASAQVARAQPPATTTPPPQDPAPATPEAQPPPIITEESPEDALDPIEPDYSLVNLPTTLRLPVPAWAFHLSHRFNLNLVCGAAETDCFSNRLSGLFGLDSGANIGLEFRFGIVRKLQAVVQRTSLGQTVQLSMQYDAWHQSETTPLSISGIASIEGDHNLGASTPDTVDRDYSPALGLVISRKVANRLAVYVEPFWVHNTAADGLATRDTGFVGVGGRLRLSSTVYLLGEYAPRVGGLALREPQFGFAIERRIGGHVFSLTFTNSPGTTLRQISSGGNPDTLTMGFNLSRKFF